MKEICNLSKEIELLSPAGNFESLKLAIFNGADAVYLGLEGYNARGGIENFTAENLPPAVAFAHLYNVKVYLTLNTLIKDEEFDEVIKQVKFALQSKVDAFIVQDIGLAFYLRQHFSNIELHASTQMGINNLEGALALKNLGFSRVVLARETPLSEIKRIKTSTDLEIEYFVQGALCVSFSGNCYLCSLLANASGNRGQCKQFCRLPFSANYDKGKRQGYLLSTKDLCMLGKLKQLAQSGVTSFKLEGRARREAYVAVATNVYRKVIDNNFAFDEKDIISLKKVYNRGDFAPGYFDSQNIIYPYIPNHMGVKIGEAFNFSKGKRFNIVSIRSTCEIKRGDILKFIKQDKEIGVLTAVDIKKENGIYKITTTATILCPCQVNMIVDNQFESNYLNKKRTIAVDVTLTLKEGKKAKVTMSAGDTQACYESEFTAERAKTMPLKEQDCFEQFDKMGEQFHLNSFKVLLGKVFLTKSQLNTLRRNCLEQLTKKILEKYEKTHKIQEKSLFLDKKQLIFDKKLPTAEIIEFDDFDKVDLTEKKIFVYKPNNFDQKIQALYDKNADKNIFISLPVMADKSEIDKIKQILFYCKDWGVVANNYWALELKAQEQTIIGSKLNVYNSHSVKYYAGRGYNKIILSIEEMGEIKNCGIILFEYCKFYPEYMIFRHCPLKEHFSGSCNNCKYDNNLCYTFNSKEFKLIRQRINSCQFVLKAKDKVVRQVKENLGKVYEV